MTVKQKAEQLALTLVDECQNPQPLIDLLIKMANWQKRQIMKNAVYGITHLDVDHSPYETVIKTDAVKDIKHGTLLKLVIFKETK